MAMNLRNNIASASVAFARSINTQRNTVLPEQVDYLIVGAGATGFAFADTLLHHSAPSTSVLMIDKNSSPGGQWVDSYGFVRLHQPSDMYGVETMKLEPSGEDCSAAKNGEEAHRATRVEILEYYDRVTKVLEEKYDFHFVGDTAFDVSQLDEEEGEEIVVEEGASTDLHQHYRYKLPGGRSIMAKKIVDARYLQPDLPIHVPPKFKFPEVINVVPVNTLAETDKLKQQQSETKHYVIIGAGKTGMDAIVHLIQHEHVNPDNILWIVPNEAWITARENIGSFAEFLHECTELQKKNDLANNGRGNIESEDFFQRGFLEWEKKGKVYRFDEDILPTKFKDATLSKSELALIKTVKRVVRNGRVESIDDEGTIHFAGGTTMSLPWSSSSTADTTFVHCSAGAFNYSKQTKKPPPIFSPHRISVQDVYGTPGFCFVGSIIGKLESLGTKFTDAEKNAMCAAPIPNPSSSPLGPSGGDIGVISTSHGYVQRLSNLNRWLKVPEIRNWLVGHRLFNLRNYNVEEIDALVDETWDVLEGYGIVGKRE
mmetsp:Transcript_12526/g.17990  ORF Transcript_12526/g.17990 Transcript_12526/m.17990 type:complete len:541 (+) Transcript_12526:167-1789(+)